VDCERVVEYILRPVNSQAREGCTTAIGQVEWVVFERHIQKIFAGRSKDDLNQRRSNMVKANKANESVHGRCAAGTPSWPVNLCDGVAYSSGRTITQFLFGGFWSQN